MSHLLTPLLWLLRLVLFVALFGLAVKNSGLVELRFYFDQVWLAPISAVVLLSFTLGVLLGLTVAAGQWLRRRNVGRSD